MKKILFLLCIICLICCSCGFFLSTEFDKLNNSNEKVLQKKLSVEEIIDGIKNMKCANEHSENVRIQDFDSIYFGEFEQDGIIENGLEDIEWIILEKDLENNKLLITSKYALTYIVPYDYPTEVPDDYIKKYLKAIYNNNIDDNRLNEMIKYHKQESIMLRTYSNSKDYRKDFNWNNNRINIFANNDFINTAFDEKEIKCINDVINNIDDIEYNNKIKILTDADNKKYFKNDFQRSLYGTTYCKDLYIDNRKIIEGDNNDYPYMMRTEDVSYISIDDNHQLRYVRDGKVDVKKEDAILEYAYWYSKLGFRPTLLIDINDNIKLDKIEKDYVRLSDEHIFSKEVNDFCDKYNIVLNEKDEIYKQTLYNSYLEFSDYINKGNIDEHRGVSFVSDWYNVDWWCEKPNIIYKYKLVDIDKDGYNELFIFHGDYLFDAFTIYNNKVKQLLKMNRVDSLGYSIYYTLLSDNSIYFNNDGRIESEHSNYVLKNGELMIINHVYSNNDMFDECIETDYQNNTNVKKDENTTKKSSGVKIAHDNCKEIVIYYDYKENIKLATTVKDSDEDKMNEDYDHYWMFDNIKFGNYDSDERMDEENWPIDWIVLDKKDDKALLISERIIDCKCFDDNNEVSDWSNSSLRKWLNNDFYNIAFNDEEKKDIVEVDNKNINLNGGDDGNTKDKIFCLSLEEVNEYFGQVDNGEDMKEHNWKPMGCSTDFARNILNQGEKLFISKKYLDFDCGTSEWWLRSMRENHRGAAIVYCNGYAEGLEKEHLLNYKNRGVRPAMWVKYK